MNATKALVNYVNFNRKNRYIVMTLSNDVCYLEVKCYCYPNSGLVLKQLLGCSKNGNWVSAGEIIELLLGCFDKNSNFEKEIRDFYQKDCKQVNSITMDIYGVCISINRNGFGLEELCRQWEVLYTKMNFGK